MRNAMRNKYNGIDTRTSVEVLAEVYDIIIEDEGVVLVRFEGNSIEGFEFCTLPPKQEFIDDLENKYDDTHCINVEACEASSPTTGEECLGIVIEIMKCTCTFLLN